MIIKTILIIKSKIMQGCINMGKDEGWLICVWMMDENGKMLYLNFQFLIFIYYTSCCGTRLGTRVIER
jgi:hypothetical protein